MTDTNWAVQPQKLARGLKFQIKRVERLYYLCSENKGANQLYGTTQLVCAFLFVYTKSKFSQDVFQLKDSFSQVSI